MANDVVVAAIDAGGRDRIGWAIEAEVASSDFKTGTGYRSLDDLIGELRGHLEAGRSVALGVEAPLYLPVAASQERVNKARVGERNRAWSASSGAAVTPLGVHQLAFVLRGLKDAVSPACVGFDQAVLAGGRSVMIWEAFVSAEDKVDSDAGDAETVARAFRRRLGAGVIESALESGDDDQWVNLAAAAILATWPDADPGLASQSCIVVRPD